MPRRYSDLERQFVLQRLVANNYDVYLTVMQTGIPENTVRRWRTKYLQSPPLGFQGKASLTVSPPFPPLPGNDLEALRDIKRQLMGIVNHLSHSIDEAVDEAPLIQRAAALAQLIDRVIKISAQLPPEPEDYLLEDNEEIPDEETEYAQTTHETMGHHRE